MILKILRAASAMWRKIVSLARPIDTNKPVIIGDKPRSGFSEAYTDNTKIYLNVDEKEFRKKFEDIILPTYEPSAHTLYDVRKPVLGVEVLENLVFDRGLYIHFHEELHPWVCPTGRTDEKQINGSLYEGIKKAEPSISEVDAMLKVNNSKNLVWDTVVCTNFLQKVHGDDELLAEKINFIFKEDGREIESQAITKFPYGILPIIYILSAYDRTTDIPISLMGSMYSTMSFNEPQVREKALDFFFDDLKSKNMPRTDALDLIKKMYLGFVSELPKKDLLKRGINKKEFIKRVSDIDDLSNPKYEDNQKYFTSAITTIFDAPSLRYNSLKGFIQVLSPYISLSEKQGSPDPNTSGDGNGDGNGDSDGQDSGDMSQDDLDGNSMSQTLDDLLDTLDDKEADNLMKDIANSSSSGTNPALDKVNIMAADEYYKKNADIIEIRNPSQENVSIELGQKKQWKLKKSKDITAIDVSKLNYQQIINFQKTTGLPVLMNLKNGFFKLNEYELIELPLKSYSAQLTGIEIPDNLILFQDSSGTMSSTRAYVGSGNRFDTLNRVKYGFKKGLYQICKELGKDMLFGVVDFSNMTKYAGLDSLIDVYESRNHKIKDISLTPQCGGTYCNSKVFDKIEKDLAPGKTICTFITDGEISGDTDSLYRKIQKFASKPDHSFVFIEIDSNSDFGKEIEDLSKINLSVVYYHVNDISSIKSKLNSILIKYT